MNKLLVVDDDIDILDAIEMLLEVHGYDVDTLTNGRDVMQIAKKNQPDLIILDYLLSGSNGKEICRQLKVVPESNHITVIMISAHPTDPSFMNECGANSFVPKPFSTQSLIQQIQCNIR